MAPALLMAATTLFTARGLEANPARTSRSLASMAGPVLEMRWRKLWMITSEVSVLPSTSMGMLSHMPLAFTTLARMVAATSLSFMGTMLGPTTNRSRIRGTSTPASISLLPLVSRVEMLRSAFRAAAFSEELLVLLSISTNVLDTCSPARALPSVVRVSSESASAISTRTSGSPEIKQRTQTI